MPRLWRRGLWSPVPKLEPEVVDHVSTWPSTRRADREEGLSHFRAASSPEKFPCEFGTRNLKNKGENRNHRRQLLFCCFWPPVSWYQIPSQRPYLPSEFSQVDGAASQELDRFRFRTRIQTWFLLALVQVLSSCLSSWSLLRRPTLTILELYSRMRCSLLKRSEIVSVSLLLRSYILCFSSRLVRSCKVSVLRRFWL